MHGSCHDMNDFIDLIETTLRAFGIAHSPQTFIILVGLAFARLVAFLGVARSSRAAVPARVKARPPQPSLYPLSFAGRWIAAGRAILRDH
jgi:hypothetical protein